MFIQQLVSMIAWICNANHSRSVSCKFRKSKIQNEGWPSEVLGAIQWQGRVQGKLHEVITGWRVLRGCKQQTERKVAGRLNVRHHCEQLRYGGIRGSWQTLLKNPAASRRSTDRAVSHHGLHRLSCLHVATMTSNRLMHIDSFK